ncbi:MAG: M23 family metallopeptidase, partial [Microthrixaceae bacterium]|nr:M23 family metallopeptidase [Microthrixaceae bacterium]
MRSMTHHRRVSVAVLAVFVVAAALGMSSAIPSFVPGAQTLNAPEASADPGWKFPFASSEAYYQYRNPEPHSTNSSGLDLTPRSAGRTTAVLAPFSGKIVAAGRTGTFYCSAIGRNTSNPYVAVQDSASGKIIELHHLSRIDVSRGATVKRGQRLGTSGREGCATGVHIHMTLKDRSGRHLSWRGQVIDNWAFRNAPGQTFKSTNGTPAPAPKPTKFSGSVSSKLWVTSNGQEVRLKVCANNLPGQTVKVDFRRPATAGYGARSWTYSKKASSKCVEFADMEGSGAVFRGVTYTSRAALNSTPSTSWSGSGCFTATGGRGRC